MQTTEILALKTSELERLSAELEELESDPENEEQIEESGIVPAVLDFFTSNYTRLRAEATGNEEEMQQNTEVELLDMMGSLLNETCKLVFGEDASKTPQTSAMAKLICDTLTPFIFKFINDADLIERSSSWTKKEACIAAFGELVTHVDSNYFDIKTAAEGVLQVIEEYNKAVSQRKLPNISSFLVSTSCFALNMTLSRHSAALGSFTQRVITSMLSLLQKLVITLKVTPRSAATLSKQFASEIDVVCAVSNFFQAAITNEDIAPSLFDQAVYQPLFISLMQANEFFRADQMAEEKLKMLVMTVGDFLFEACSEKHADNISPGFIQFMGKQFLPFLLSTMKDERKGYTFDRRPEYTQVMGDVMRFLAKEDLETAKTSSHDVMKLCLNSTMASKADMFLILTEVARALGDEVENYLKDLKSMIISGLGSQTDMTQFECCTTLVAELSHSAGNKFTTILPDVMETLLKQLTSNRLPPKTFATGVELIADIALSVGPSIFQIYLRPLFTLFDGITQHIQKNGVSYEEEEEDVRTYICESYTSLLLQFKTTPEGLEQLKFAIPAILSFVDMVAKDKRHQHEELVSVAVGLVGDLSSAYGEQVTNNIKSNKDMIQLVQTALVSSNTRAVQVAKWVMTTLFPARK